MRTNVSGRKTQRDFLLFLRENGGDKLDGGETSVLCTEREGCTGSIA